MRLKEFAPAGGGGSGNYFQALASAWYNGVFDTGSLPKGIKTQEDVERLLNRGIVAPDGKMRKYHIDYNSDFDGVEIYSDDYYEYGDHDDTIDSRTGQKWGPYDFMAFSDEQLDEGVAEAKKKKKKKSSRSLRGYFFPGYAYYGSGESGEGGGDGGGGESINRGVAEGSDPWGSEGRFVGDTGPTQITNTVPRVQLRIGDRVVYKPTEQRASIEALSQDGTQARIHIPSPMGGRTFNCRTADLKALGSLRENRNLCNVCGQTPCNCTH